MSDTATAQDPQGATLPAESQDGNPQAQPEGTTADDSAAHASAAPEATDLGTMEKTAMDAILKTEEERRHKNFAAPDTKAAAEAQDGDAPSKDQATPAKEKETKKTDDTPIKRLADTQRAFHESQQEVAKLKERIKEMETKPAAADKADDVLAKLDLPEETRAALKEMPELHALTSAILKQVGSTSSQEKKAEAERALADAEGRHKAVQAELSKQWDAGVRATYPDYDAILESNEFKDWRASHPATVSGLLKDKGQYDPDGAISVIKAFKSATTTKRDIDASRARGQEAASRPGRTKQAVKPPADAGEPAQKSIRELEQESMEAILRQERQKRRSF